MPLMRVVERMAEPAHRRRKRAEAAVEIALLVLMAATAWLLFWVLW